MSKFEFVTECNPLTLAKIFYTKADGFFVENSLSSDKAKAYDRFVNISSGINTNPIIEILETRYSITK